MRRALAAVTATALALALGGCITVFPKAEPATQYAFGADFPASQPATPGWPAFNVLRSTTTFDTAASGDGILTRDGGQVAYVAHARWIASAAQLFDEAEMRAFGAHGGPARLVQRGQPVKSDAELRLNVQSFEARYLGGMGAAPTVVVTVQATLTDLADHRVRAEHTFEVRKLADANRVGAIVSAFDAATVEALTGIVSWTAAEGGPAAATPG